MFGSIKNWMREQRGLQRLEQAESVSKGLFEKGDEVICRCALTMAETYHEIRSHYGSPANMHSEGKKKIVKHLFDDFEKTFEFDMGRGYGLFFLCMHFESQIQKCVLAESVLQLTTEMLMDAMKIDKGLEKEESLLAFKIKLLSF